MPDSYLMNLINWSHLAEMLIVPLCIIAAALTAGITLNRIVIRQLNGQLDPERNSLTYIFIHALRGVPISLCLVIGLYWIANTIDIPPFLSRFFSYILFTVIIFSITRVLARTVTGLVTLQLAHTLDQDKIIDSSEADTSNSLIHNILAAIIYAMGLLVILQYYGISIAPILTALGVGGMAVALALQDTLANIFSGIHLLLSKQITLGDYIRLGTGEEGRVTGITWRYTKMVPVGASNTIVIPNKTIAAANITNFSQPERDIAIVLPLGVAYDSDLDQVERVTLDVAHDVIAKLRSADLVSSDKEPAVRFHTFGESSIDFNVILHSSRFDNQAIIKHEFIKALIRRYRAENIEIPYPVRTVLTPDEDTQN